METAIKYFQIFLISLLLCLHPGVSVAGGDVGMPEGRIAVDPLNTVYGIEGGKICLKDGLSEISVTPGSAAKVRTSVKGDPVYGDVDGDVDGDGYTDLIVAASGDNHYYSDLGSARVIRSSDLANDTDLDHIANSVDNCPQTANFGQEDSDEDGVGDACDNCISNANPGQEPSAVNPNCGEACATASCVGVICENH